MNLLFCFPRLASFPFALRSLTSDFCCFASMGNKRKIPVFASKQNDFRFDFSCFASEKISPLSCNLFRICGSHKVS